MSDQDRALLALPRHRLLAVLRLAEFLMGQARLQSDVDATIAGVAERLIEAGVPLDRLASVIQLLHAEDQSAARIWERGRGTRYLTFPVGRATDDDFVRSPMAEAHRTGAWVDFRLADTPDDRYGIVPELRQAGFTHYLCAPVKMATRMIATLNFATKAPNGFTAEDMAVLRAAFPAIAVCQEILATNRILRDVTRMYVGDEPHRRILAGDVHLGRVVRIRSAILFADMRRFTELTAAMTAEQATDLLNAYYDCVVPAVERHGGEVLKFIGDGILAIFRTEAEGDPPGEAGESGPHLTDPQDDATACRNAFAAAQAALLAVAEQRHDPAFRIGVALHLGQVAYGNVGSGLRLDYTAIGRDVNLASRIATLCGGVGEPFLASGAVAQHLPPRGLATRGHHALKGLAEPVEVFALPGP